MENECRVTQNDDVQELLVYAKCSFENKQPLQAEVALLQARMLNPWNNQIQKNLSIVTQEKTFDIHPSHLWAIRLPFELSILIFFIFLILTKRIKEYRFLFLILSIGSLGVATWAYTQEKKFQTWTVLSENTSLYSLPNFNYEIEKLKKGSLIYVKENTLGFSKIIYKDQIVYIPTEKLFANNLLNSQNESVKDQLERIWFKLSQFFS